MDCEFVDFELAAGELVSCEIVLVSLWGVSL